MKRSAFVSIPFRIVFLSSPFALFFSVLCLHSPASGEERIRPWVDNPRFWQYRGMPVLLIGGSDEDNLFNHPVLMRGNLDRLHQIGGNYIRGTLSCRDEGNVWPYVKQGERYDLNQFNPEFWERLRICLEEAKKRDIIVQIEIWATFDCYRDFWKQNPFNPSRNRNYTTENTRLSVEWDHHPASKVQPFFESIPLKNNDRILLNYQENFVRKVLEISLPYPNVLYCLDNETRASEAWAVYWAEFIHREADRRGVAAHVTEMWDLWDIQHDDHKRTYGRPDLFSYVDVSQNNWQVGRLHYDKLLWMQAQLSKSRGGNRPINNVKVYGRVRPGEPCVPELNLERWWRNLFAGCASTRFHRPDSGIGLNEAAQKAIATARSIFAEFDYFRAVPRPDGLGECDENEAYCLAISNDRFALYFTKGGQVELKAIEPKAYRVRWFNPTTAQAVSTQEISANVRSKSISLQSPDTEHSWLAIVQ